MFSVAVRIVRSWCPVIHMQHQYLYFLAMLLRHLLRCSAATDCVVQSRQIEPVRWSHIKNTVMENFSGLPAYSNCTFSVNARPSQEHGLLSEWTNYTHVTAQQGTSIIGEAVCLELLTMQYAPINKRSEKSRFEETWELRSLHKWHSLRVIKLDLVSQWNGRPLRTFDSLDCSLVT